MVVKVGMLGLYLGQLKADAGDDDGDGHAGDGHGDDGDDNRRMGSFAGDDDEDE
jgi:hypothetical protein